jgi:PAS domain S-box-containing protein
MSWFEENKQIISALVKSIFAFGLFSLMIFSAIVYYDFSKININILAFILAITCAVLISKSIYEVSAESARTKKMAEALANKLIKSSQQLFLEVYNNSPIAYLIVDTNGKIVSANIASARLFGKSTQQLIKGDLFAIISPEGDEHQSVIKLKFQNGVVVSDEDVKVVRGKETSWTKASIFQFSGTDGEKLSLVTFVDITKQREVDIAKSEFVSLASHQLRTPISGMRWSAELLLLDGVETLSVQQKRYIDRLLSSIQRMSGLVDDFLQVSRFELGTRVIKQEMVSLPDLFDDIIAEQASVASGKRLNISKHYDPTISQISTDLGLLRMIVTNLYVNAVKYSRLDGEISLSFKRVGDDLLVEVRDNGMGIPLAEQQRVFSKIFRASNAVKEVPDGTGLGLYIVQKSVQSLHGRITFQSAENMGTTFTVQIPTQI